MSKIPETTSNLVARGWELIQLLSLNGEARFCLLDRKGEKTSDVTLAACIYDERSGEAILPQVTPIWLEDMLTRYRVSLQWSEIHQAFQARTPAVNNAHAIGTGATPGIAVYATGSGATPGLAVVDALIVAAKNGCLPPKHPYPQS